MSPALAYEITEAGLQLLLPGIAAPIDRSKPAKSPKGAAAKADAPLRMHRLVVPCTAELRDAAQSLAQRCGQSLTRLVGAVLLVMPDDEGGEPEPLAGIPESGGKKRSGGTRLALRVPMGHPPARVRRALAMLVRMGTGGHSFVPAAELGSLRSRLHAAEAKTSTLKDSIKRLAFHPLRGGVNSREEALYVLGLPPSARIDSDTVSSRFRAVAPIFHPDTGVVASHARMVQVIDARKLLLRNSSG